MKERKQLFPFKVDILTVFIPEHTLLLVVYHR